MMQRWMQGPVGRALEQGTSVLLKGPPGVGKTTFARGIPFEQVYLSFDDLALQDTLRAGPKTLSRLVRKRRLNVLDEVQRMPELLGEVGRLVDEGFVFLLLSSNTAPLFKNMDGDMGGDMGENIDGLCVMELGSLAFGEAGNQLVADGSENSFFLETAGEMNFVGLTEGAPMVGPAEAFGGYPSSAVLWDDEEREEWLREFGISFFQRDIVTLGDVKDRRGFRSLCRSLAAGTGASVNIHQLARQSGVSHVTARRYLEVLRGMSLVFRLPARTDGPARQTVKGPRLYFSDTGFLHFSGGHLSDEQIFQTFVISELRKRVLLSGLGEESLSFYRSRAGAEVPLIVETDDTLYLYDISPGERPDHQIARRLGRFAAGVQTHKRLVPRVIYKGHEFSTVEGMPFVPVKMMYGIG